MISDFIGEVKTRGMARTNRYTVEIVDPLDPDGARLIQLFCESTSLPGMNLITTPHRVYGESREMPYERGFEPVTMSFYVDGDMMVKKMFDSWMTNIVDPFTRQLNYYKSYIRDINITVYDVDEKFAPYTLTLYEAYPKTIGTIQLDASAKDVMKLPVTFTYKYWKTAGIDLAKPTVYSEQDPQNSMTSDGYTYDEEYSDTYSSSPSDLSDFYG